MTGKYTKQESKEMDEVMEAMIQFQVSIGKKCR